MPLHDWECTVCGALILDRYQPRIASEPPACPKECVSPTQRSTMELLWSRFSHDQLSSPVHYEHDSGDVETVTTLSRVREIERQSADLYRQGLGRPVAFRQYNQGSGNMRDNVFGKPQHPEFSTRSRRGVPFVVRRESGPLED